MALTRVRYVPYVAPGCQYWPPTEKNKGVLNGSLVFIQQNPLPFATLLNGACHRVAPDATAFGHRDASFATVIAGMWEDPKDNQANIAWVRDYYAATAPHSKEGGYINFMAGDDQERVAYNYGASYERLIDIKKKYDAGNLFRMNQNIRVP